MREKNTLPVTHEPWLLYDGRCPFCSRYVKLIRLRDTMPTLRLINAREDGVEFRRVSAVGLEIDEGMILALNGQLYHGKQCIQILALMSTPIGPLNRLNHWIFSSPTRSHLLYPLLRMGRNMVLRFLGIGRICTAGRRTQ